MASIVGESYRNADSSTIDSSIADVTTRLNEATRLYNEAMTAIALCNNRSVGCVDKSGRHISTWRDQRDRYAPMVTQLKKELTELLALKEKTATTSTQTASQIAGEAAARQAIANADTSQTTSTALKWGLIIGGILIVVIGGIFIYKKIKK